MRVCVWGCACGYVCACFSGWPRCPSPSASSSSSFTSALFAHLLVLLLHPSSSSCYITAFAIASPSSLPACLPSPWPHLLAHLPVPLFSTTPFVADCFSPLNHLSARFPCHAALLSASFLVFFHASSCPPLSPFRACFHTFSWLMPLHSFLSESPFHLGSFLHCRHTCFCKDLSSVNTS